MEAIMNNIQAFWTLPFSKCRKHWIELEIKRTSNIKIQNWNLKRILYKKKTNKHEKHYKNYILIAAQLSSILIISCLWCSWGSCSICCYFKRWKMGRMGVVDMCQVLDGGQQVGITFFLWLLCCFVLLLFFHIIISKVTFLIITLWISLK